MKECPNDGENAILQHKSSDNKVTGVSPRTYPGMGKLK